MKLKHMKKRYQQYFAIIFLMVICIVFVSCGKESKEKSGEETGVEESSEVIVGSVDKPEEDADDEKSDGGEPGEGESDSEQESGQEPEPVVLDATYTTRYGAVNQVTFAPVVFDYPSSWQVASEEVDQNHERVVLSDGKGAEICFAYYLNPTGGLGRSIWKADVEKTAESRFVAGMIQATDVSGLNPFMVAAVTPEGMDAPTMYAVLPEAQAVTGGEFLGLPEVALKFDYGGWMSLVANGGENGLDERQTQEVLAVLSSFRTT